MRKILPPLMAVYLIALITACTTLSGGTKVSSAAVTGPEAENTSAGEQPAEAQMEKSLPPLEELPFEEAGIGFTGPEKKEYLAFYNRDDMVAYISPRDLFREIDFSSEMVLACFMGEQATGGYMCRVTGVEEGTETLTAYVEITEPAAGDLVAQMITSPWSAVALRRSNKTIEWQEIRAER